MIDKLSYTGGDTYPDVRITERERLAISRKTTAGLKHHKLNMHFKPLVALPAHGTLIYSHMQ